MNNCPACKAPSAEYLDLFPVNQEFTHDILPAKYRVLKCKTCNLHFKDYIPTDAELERFYNSLGDKEWNYQQELPHEKFLKEILRKLPDNSSVLDVGCNTGRLLKDETKRLGCFGVEINKEAAKIAEQEGLQIVADKVESGNLGVDKYELITLIDVFEHLNDPMPFIRQLISALKPGGKLYVFTGRTDCLPSYLCGPFYWYYKPAQHLIFLNNRFISWFRRHNPGLRISTIPMRHFYSNLRVRIYQISWLIVWRFFSPNSPYKLIGIKKFTKMKEPFMITSWKDHVFFVIEKV